MSNERTPSEKHEKHEKTEGKGLSKDIVPLLKGWDYEPGTINVRKINGNDGAPKLQMRLDLRHHARKRPVFQRRIKTAGERGAGKLRRAPSDIESGRERWQQNERNQRGRAPSPDR